MAKVSMERRSVIISLSRAGCAVPFIGPAMTALAKDKEFTEKDLADTTKPPSSGLKYVHDAAKAPTRKTAKSGVAAKDQFCSNCQLYTPGGILKGTKEKVGKCLMIPTGQVKAQGWCISWIKKA